MREVQEPVLISGFYVPLESVTVVSQHEDQSCAQVKETRLRKKNFFCQNVLLSASLGRKMRQRLLSAEDTARCRSLVSCSGVRNGGQMRRITTCITVMTRAVWRLKGTTQNPKLHTVICEAWCLGL